MIVLHFIICGFPCSLAFLSYIRPEKSLSYSAPRLNEDMIMRFICFRDFSLEIAARVIACRVRTLEPGVVVDDKVKEYATLMFERVLSLLDEMTPCVACYDQTKKQCEPVERPDEPILCLQEKRTHPSKYHRTSRRVKSSSAASLWTRVLNILPFNDTWNGSFCPPRLPEVDIEGLVDTVRTMVHQSDDKFLEELLSLQRRFSAMYVKLAFVQINAPFSLRDSELEHVKHYVDDGTLKQFGQPIGSAGISQLKSGESPEGDAIIRSSGIDESFNGEINFSVAKELNLIHATHAPAEMPYCIGCGRKCLSSSASDRGTTEPEKSSRSGNAWVRTLLKVVGMLPNAAGADGLRLDRDNEKGCIDETLSSIEQQLAESGVQDNWLDSSRGDGDKARQVCFSTETAMPAFQSSDVKKGGLKRSASQGIPRQHALLALCPRCWRTIECSRSTSELH